MKTTLLIFFLISSLIGTAQPPAFKWARSIGGIDLDWCMSITTDDSSNVYSTGYFEKTADFDPGPGAYLLTCGSMNYDPFVYKLDSSGNFVWAKQFKGTSQYGGEGLSVKLDASRNVYITGTFSGTVDFDPGPGVYNLSPGSPSDIFVAKLDPNGNFVWAKQFTGIGISGNIGKCLSIDNNGDVLVTGLFSLTVDFDPGPGTFNITSFGQNDIFVVKLSSSGLLIWAKQIGGPQGDEGQSLDIDSYGNAIFTGKFQGTADFDPGSGVFNLTSINSTGDIFVCKLDPSGNFVWAKSFAAYQSLQINIAQNGNIVTVGDFGNTVDFDPGPGIYNITAPNGGCFVNRWDNNGNFINAQALLMGPPAPNLDFSLRAIDQDAAGNTYLTGFFLGEIDFDPGPGTNLVNSPYQRLSFICKLSSSGNLMWAVTHQTTYYANGLSIALDTAKNIYTAGIFGNDITFNPGSNPITLTANGYQDFFICKMGHCSSSTYSTISHTACNVYTLNGHSYTASGTYTQTINNSAGCDSIITLILTINGSNDTTSVTACDNYTWQGQTYTSSGFYRDTLVSSTGCDSILNLNLTIHYKVLSTVYATICQGQTYSGHSSTGIYIDTYVAANGCDSIRTLNLTVSPVLYSTIAATICDDQNYAGHNASGIYIDTLVSVFGCDSIRTLNLTVKPRAFTMINASICQGQSYYAGGANQTTSGIYKDTLLTYLGCDSIITTTLTVNPKPKPDLGPDRNLCVSSAAIITPGAFNNYLWQDNSTQPNFTVNSIGTYWVKVTDANNCTATDSLKVLAIDTVPRNFLPADQTVCFGNEVKISLTGYKNYLWSTGSTSGNISLKSFGTFYLTVTDFNNCSGTDSITVQRANCIPIGIPNAFTPNGDGLNDVFKPTINQAIQRFSFVIFNRYGETVFETREYGTGWDGTYKGKKQPAGSYVYRIKFTNTNGWESENNGSVLLIR